MSPLNIQLLSCQLNTELRLNLVVNQGRLRTQQAFTVLYVQHVKAKKKEVEQ